MGGHHPDYAVVLSRKIGRTIVYFAFFRLAQYAFMRSACALRCAPLRRLRFLPVVKGCRCSVVGYFDSVLRTMARIESNI